jgi:hypothetical protein
LAVFGTCVWLDLGGGVWPHPVGVLLHGVARRILGELDIAAVGHVADRVLGLVLGPL